MRLVIALLRMCGSLLLRLADFIHVMMSVLSLTAKLL